MSNMNILISGSGIAGSVFAFWLLRAYPNASITIVERSKSLRLTGASVDIRSSAADIIKWMNAEEEIRRNTTKEEGVHVVNADDKPAGTIRATGRTDIQSFTSEFEIFRGTLAKIFMDPISERVNIIYDEHIVHYEQRDEGVAVTFAKSKETKIYDLLVAADGYGSKIRGMMMNTTPQEHMFGQGVHVAYFSIKNDLLQGSRMARWYNTTNGRVIFLRPDPNPAGRTRAHFINVTAARDTKTKEKLDATMSEGNESYMRLLEETFSDAGWKAQEVLRGMRDSDDFYCSLFGQIRTPKIQDGRVALVGDSGYATPGFGTSLAIIGGYVLAGELLRSSGDVNVALARYEAIVLPFVKSSQGGGDGGDTAMRLMNPQSWWGIKIRNLILGTVTGLRLDRVGMAIASAVGIAERRVDFPDYRWPAESE
ncbi:hypothetical protein FKW77_003501 [Venturia effusa]|uniref:FAD-binding domain-containing protein n=1 Tax=Venturia effusa TaxID=50376 RepID=A0A517L2Z4_9PEZI|nr:hypothetical protein FKW77_003501 [Venturia effusa]